VDRLVISLHLRPMRLRDLFRWKNLILGFGIGGALVLGCHYWVEAVAGPFCHGDLAKVPKMKAAVVLGCAPTIQGRPNLFFTKRMEAAVRLHQKGKVDALIVSGDNGSKEYDEATAMKEALVKAGIPAASVYLDYAGFRTLDSVVRAKEIFGQEAFVVVSQRFHNERAVFLARQRGLKAVGYDAGDLRGRGGLMTHLREYLARVQAVLDVTLLGTQPRFLGAPVVIP
jgi:SanA protein